MHHTFASAFAPASCGRGLVCAIALAVAGFTSAYAQQTPESVSTRGELLYSTHCIECHTTQMHWRAQRKAVDWDTLRFQVRRWQGVVNLGWSDTDIDDVARYLNDTIYRFPRQVSGGGRESGLLAATEQACLRSVVAPAP